MLTHVVTRGSLKLEREHTETFAVKPRQYPEGPQYNTLNGELMAAHPSTQAQEALLRKIKEAVDELKQQDYDLPRHTEEIEALARAYRAVIGGAQPGGGCNCSK